MSPALEPRPEPTLDRGTPADAQREAILREIAEDARREPERFLQESRVPEGGE
jgi:hypothetical protein